MVKKLITGIKRRFDQANYTRHIIELLFAVTRLALPCIVVSCLDVFALRGSTAELFYTWRISVYHMDEVADLFFLGL